jgi:hypothetical protein
MARRFCCMGLTIGAANDTGGSPPTARRGRATCFPSPVNPWPTQTVESRVSEPRPDRPGVARALAKLGM